MTDQITTPRLLTLLSQCLYNEIPDYPFLVKDTEALQIKQHMPFSVPLTIYVALTGTKRYSIDPKGIYIKICENKVNHAILVIY
jgi:hypothetical protein